MSIVVVVRLGGYGQTGLMVILAAFPWSAGYLVVLAHLPFLPSQ